jgi:hypothetical protein
MDDMDLILDLFRCFSILSHQATKKEEEVACFLYDKTRSLNEPTYN